MIQIDLKPLSVNQVWMGRRFKTKTYKDYEIELIDLLPDNFEIPKEGNLATYFEWGFSSAASDWDNPVKPFQDVLQKKYDFNDSRIHIAIVRKKKVKRGEEYIRFQIKPVKSMASYFYNIFMELIRL